jgi:hypothetical protein
MESLLTDAEIMAEAEEIAHEMAAGERIDIADLAARLGVSLEDALALGAEYATELHGVPMTVIRREDMN